MNINEILEQIDYIEEDYLLSDDITIVFKDHSYIDVRNDQLYIGKQHNTIHHGDFK